MKCRACTHGADDPVFDVDVVVGTVCEQCGRVADVRHDDLGYVNVSEHGRLIGEADRVWRRPTAIERLRRACEM